MYVKEEIKKKILKSVKLNKRATSSQRYFANFHLSRLRKIGTVTKVNNRCVESGRVWSVTSHTNYSRFLTRRELYRSNLPGFKRASW